MSGNHLMMKFFWGAAVGAGLALLLAPKTGSDTRRLVGGAARKIKERASGAVDGVKNLAHEGSGV